MSENTIDDATIVRSLLAMNKITPSAPEVEKLVAGYPATRAMVAGLYSMPGVRYEEPALTFDPRV